MRLVVLLSAVAAAAVSVYVPLPAPYSDHCILDDGTDLYDPAHQFDIPWFNIDLDKPPRERWTQVASIYGANIDRLINVLAQLVLPIFPDAFEVIDDVFGDMADKIPQPYQDELRSISESSGVALGRIVVYNIFYEIFTVCTSVIAQDQNGELIHARNLDFGLFLGWNATTHNWSISEALRTMIINVNWIKDGKILYKSNNFAGFVGIYNGLKQNKFTVTANERFMLDGGYVGILRWLLGMEPNGKWMTWLTRETLETANSYAEAKDMFMNIPMLSPVYYILAGTQPGEGVILSRALNGTDLVNSLEPEKPDGWFLLQTNYDPNVAPLFLDDRRTPGNKCMKTMGQHNVGFRSIYNVLSSKTNLNKLTTYTVLMNVKTGQFETHTQGCPGYCWPF